MLRENNAQILESSENKTRIVIAGAEQAKFLAKIVLHVLDFNQKETDIFFDDKVKISDENDFTVIFGEENENLADFLGLKPNIAVLSEIKYAKSEESYSSFLNEITSGGVLIYNGENLKIAELVDNSEKYFRKLAYSMPEFEKMGGQIFIKTSIGEMPISISDEDNLIEISGAKLLCQQLGIMEDEFYEALMNF